MTHVHPQGDLGLSPISAEVALSHEDADEKPQVTVGERQHSPSMT